MVANIICGSISICAIIFRISLLLEILASFARGESTTNENLVALVLKLFHCLEKSYKLSQNDLVLQCSLRFDGL